MKQSVVSNDSNHSLKANLSPSSSQEQAVNTLASSSKDLKALTQDQQDSPSTHHNLSNPTASASLNKNSSTFSPRISILILLIFFSAQMWAAGSYYWGDYPWDERFSWRMFSTVRSLSCQVQMWESSEQGQLCPDGQTAHCTQVRLSSRYHMVWVNLLKRGRRQVLEKLAQQECTQRQAHEAIFINLTCPSPEPPHQAITIQSPTVNLCEQKW